MSAARILTLCETVLPDAGAETSLPDVPHRMVYVAEGDATMSDRRFVRRNGTDTGCYCEGAIRITAEAPGTTLWSWSLTETQIDVQDRYSAIKLQRQIEVEEAPEHVMRLDRVDFPPGGVALTHVHPGPGIRIVLHGEIGIEQTGQMEWMKAGEPWFERGPDPVYAPTTEQMPTAFVRCMVLPIAWRGRNTIRYVKPEDADKPKSQRYHRFIDALVSL